MPKEGFNPNRIPNIQPSPYKSINEPTDERMTTHNRKYFSEKKKKDVLSDLGSAHEELRENIRQGMIKEIEDLIVAGNLKKANSIYQKNEEVMRRIPPPAEYAPILKKRLGIQEPPPPAPLTEVEQIKILLKNRHIKKAIDFSNQLSQDIQRQVFFMVFDRYAREPAERFLKFYPDIKDTPWQVQILKEKIEEYIKKEYYHGSIIYAKVIGDVQYEAEIARRVIEKAELNLSKVQLTNLKNLIKTGKTYG